MAKKPVKKKPAVRNVGGLGFAKFYHLCSVLTEAVGEEKANEIISDHDYRFKEESKAMKGKV